MSHLDDRASALVDGELSHEERERALAHLAHCARCRADVENERLVKSTIRAQPQPPLPPGLVTSLRQLAEPGDPLPPERSPFPAGTRPPARWRPVDGRPNGRPPGRSGRDGVSGAPARRSRLRRVRFAAGGALAVAAVAVGLAVLGGTAEDGAPVVPPVERLTVEHARTGQAPPFADSALLIDSALLNESPPPSVPAPSSSGPSGDPAGGR